MTAVGVSSRKASGLSAAISAIPASRRKRHPVSCVMRSRAKRLAVSTMIVRTERPQGVKRQTRRHVGVLGKRMSHRREGRCG